MNGAQAIDILGVAQNVLYIVLILKLWRDQLLGQYKFFTGYIGVSALIGWVRLAVPPHTDAYAEYYFCTQPILIVATFLAISEMYTLVLKKLPALAAVGKRYVLPAAVVVAVSLSGLTLLAKWTPNMRQSAFLLTYFTIEQFLYGSILLVVLLIFSFLLFFPITLPRNIILHSSTFAVYLLLHAGARMMLVTYGTSMALLLNTVVMTGAMIALLLWVVRFSPAGELIELKAGVPHFSQDRERRILQGLDSLNATLQKTVKK